MLTEIEELLIKTLRDNVKGVAKEKIAVATMAVEPPAIAVLCSGFRIEGEEVAGSTSKKRVELDESFSLENGQKVYKLRNKPIEGLQVELPVGLALKENQDYIINYNKATITFSDPLKPSKGKGIVKYATYAESIIKSLKIAARYIIDAQGEDWKSTDALAEETVKALLLTKESIEQQGISFKPIAGRTVIGDGKDASRRIQLAYLFERDIVIETAFPMMTKIEIIHKKT